MEYIEREDEFDIHPIEEIHKRRLDLEDEQIDALAIEPIKGGFDGDAFRMPVLLNIDDSGESEEDIVAIGPGTMRRKSPGESREWMHSTEAAASGDERVSRRAPAGASRSNNRSRKR